MPRRDWTRTARPWLLAVSAGCLALLSACGHRDGEALADVPPDAAATEPEEGAFPVLARHFSSEDIFPCSECHDDTLPPNPERRVLSMAHEDVVLRHDEKHRWCLDCHDAKNRDKLHLASGELVDFTESYRLCGQCHGDKYRDWRVGVHGRRTGRWDGEKEYLLCVHCHNAHDPAFKPLEPKPVPERPRRDR